MATKSEDWVVSDVTRRQAEYSDKLELISFKASYRNGPTEQLSEVPFPLGTTDTELAKWRADDTEDRSGQLRVPDQVPSAVRFGTRGCTTSC